jgi:hypothetical protein
MVKLTKKKFIKIIKGGAKTNPVKPKKSIFSGLFLKKNKNLEKFNNEKAIKDYEKAIYTLYNNTYRTDITDNVANIFNEAADILTIEYSEKLPNEPNELNNIMKLNKIKDDIIINKYENAFENIFIDYKNNIQEEYELDYKNYYNSYNNILKEESRLRRQGKSDYDISLISNAKKKVKDIELEKKLNIHIDNLHNKDKDLIKQFSAILTKDTKDPQNLENLENLWKLKKAKDGVIITDYNNKMNSIQNPNNNEDSINKKMTKLTAKYEKILGRDPSFYWLYKYNLEELNIQEQKDKKEFINSKSKLQITIVEENFGGGYRKKHKKNKKNKKNKKTLIIK